VSKCFISSTIFILTRINSGVYAKIVVIKPIFPNRDGSFWGIKKMERSALIIKSNKLLIKTPKGTGLKFQNKRHVPFWGSQ